MGTKKLINTINIEFWKKEKVLFLFHVLCLWFIQISILVLCRDSKVSNILIFIIKNGEEGILVLSIMFGFYLVWSQAIKERKKDIAILKMLGQKVKDILLYLQLELLCFQIFAGIGTIIAFIIFANFLENLTISTLISNFFRIQFDIQILFLGIEIVFLKRVNMTASDLLM